MASNYPFEIHWNCHPPFSISIAEQQSDERQFYSLILRYLYTHESNLFFFFFWEYLDSEKAQLFGGWGGLGAVLLT